MLQAYTITERNRLERNLKIRKRAAHSSRTVNEDRNGTRIGRRQVLRGLVGGAAIAVAETAVAQDGRPWWERVIDGGQPEGVAVAARREAAREALDDLRSSKTPWRSDVMLDAIDDAIDRFQRIAENQDWPKLPNGRLLRVGDYDERVPLLRRRLAMSGELPERVYRNTFADHEYDPWLEAAVRKFQRGHGLRDSGLVNRPTRAQLNVSAAQRVLQLETNRRRIADLMRMRVEDRYILVNAAAFQLEAVEKYEVMQRHRVIVGKPDRQTPDIQATVRALNFFPHWRVPMSVARKDLFPRLAEDLSYLEEHRIRVLRGHYNGEELDPTAIDWRAADAREIKFRQDPGPWNALGLVRIDMPNPEIVYMHDTPMKDLFTARDRTFSAGCVRVQDVMRLVSWIAMYEPGWDDPEERINAILAAGNPVDVTLTRPIPVYFTYITAWAEPDGTVIFRPDVYGRDGAEELVGEADPDAFRPPETLSP